MPMCASIDVGLRSTAPVGKTSSLIPMVLSSSIVCSLAMCLLCRRLTLLIQIGITRPHHTSVSTSSTSQAAGQLLSKHVTLKDNVRNVFKLAMLVTSSFLVTEAAALYDKQVERPICYA